MKLTIIKNLHLPMIPNYIKAEDGGWWPIQEIDEEALRQLGKAWTDALIKKARLRGLPEGKF